jgi:DNA polymerase III sliding clamp (beta) subunit (PCNA family)
MKTHIEIPVADLKSVLPGLSKIVSKRSTLPALGCVKVTLASDHSLRIMAHNLDQIAMARFTKPCTGKPGELLVCLEELAGIVKHCAASDVIELSADSKESSISYPAADTRIKKPLKYVALDEYPPAMEVNSEPVKLDDAFKEALRQALDCAGTDESRYNITGACLDVSNKEAHYVVGTDGNHLFSANSFLFDMPESIIVQPGKFLTWSGFIDDGPWTLRFQPVIKGGSKAADKPAWVRLDSDHWTYVSKPIEGNYPNWKQVVPPATALKSHITLGEPGIKMILEALPLLPGTNEMNQPVSLEIKGDHLTLKAQGSAKEWTEIPIPAKVSGLPVSISLNRTYLAKALKFGCAQIDIEDKTSPVLFSAEGRMMVICPLGPPDAKKVPAAPTTPSTSPTENGSAAALPPPAETNTTAESPERNQAMAQNNGVAVTRGNLNGHSTEPEETPAIDQMLAQIGTVREGVKKVLEDLGNFERLVRRAAKEQRLNEKEINRARSTLRSLQNVAL